MRPSHSVRLLCQRYAASPCRILSNGAEEPLLQSHRSRWTRRVLTIHNRTPQPWQEILPGGVASTESLKALMLVRVRNVDDSQFLIVQM
jgi:hypothetical protein